jgi:hypothetical protein
MFLSSNEFGSVLCAFVSLRRRRGQQHTAIIEIGGALTNPAVA